MPEGLVRTDSNNGGASFRDGQPVTLPKNFGTPVTLPHQFGITIPNADPTTDSNPVDWQTPNPAHFGNTIGGSTPPPVGKAFVQAKISAEFNSAAPVASFDAPTTAGNCILVYSQLFAASNHVISSVTDDSGTNVYTLILGPDNSPADGFGVGCWRQVWACFNAAPATAVTSNITGGGTGMIGLTEVSGCTAVDATHFNIVANAVTLDAGTITTTVAGDLLVDFMGFMLGSAGHPFDTTGIIPDWIVQLQGSGVTQIGENMMVQTQIAGAAGDYTIQASVFPAAGTGGTGGSDCVALK